MKLNSLMAEYNHCSWDIKRNMARYNIALYQSMSCEQSPTNGVYRQLCFRDIYYSIAFS